MVVKKSNGCKKKVVSDLPRATLKLESTKTIPSEWNFYLKLLYPQKMGVENRHLNFSQFLKIYLPYTLLQKATGRCISPKLRSKPRK